MLLFFGTCDMQSGHVDIASGERQENSDDQISHHNNSDVLCMFSSGASQKKSMKIL
jgi:hypothetical protein